MAAYSPAVQMELLDLESFVPSSEDEQTERRWPVRSLICGTMALAMAAVLLVHGSPARLGADLEAVQLETGLYPDHWESVEAPAATTTGVHAEAINSVNELTGGKDVKIFSNDPLARPENLKDGNLCSHDEELFGYLCYKKCSLLTNGKAPVRLSAFSCAKSQGFSDFFQPKVGTLMPCKGYDVSGDEAGNGCPHKPGTCLLNEEFHLGKCFKKCDLLTNGQYPHRTSAETCCKTKSLIECIEPTKSIFNTDFNVGGGHGKDEQSHPPEEKLTELGQ
mmetsp:Transcript_121569/g.289002  ORF Transcript_121569/g.289002 Transcript_121569/m.289002 type:complete len:277 (-) Transcript_121569:193-1023(-)